MKTTPEGLTHLVNMLVDVVNLQRKAQGTPAASCNIEMCMEDGRVTVRLIAETDLYVDPPTVTLQSGAPLSADNNRTLTPADVEAAADALEATDYRDHATTSMEAVERVLRAAGCQLPDRGAVG